MADDLDYIETLDDLSNAIKLARQQLDGKNVATLERDTSTRAGLFSLSDLPSDLDEDDEDNDELDPTIFANRRLRALLLSWEALVETLFVHKVFLEYAPSLERCIAQLSDIDPADMPKLRDLVDLMRQAVEENDMHQECAELRYVTLLEIVLSYSIDWTPSSSINEVWEDVDLHIESDCQAVDFRRVAYKVLVQLPWVPASNGLFLACGYEESETIEDDLPEHLAAKFDQIYDSPILRCDRVHQVLENLSEGEPFTVVISFAPDDNSPSDGSSEGMGKTTLAALLASHPTIVQKYTVLWVDLDTSSGTGRTIPLHRSYMSCLQNICDQLGVSPNWPDMMLRLEDAPIRTEREREHMVLAKECIASILDGLEQNILLVLDGIQGEQDYDWFCFVESQSSIVISNSMYIPRASYTIEMEGLGVDEAIALFAKESASDPELAILRTVEAKTIFQLCLYHPLLVRTAAHWFKLKQVTAGPTKALEELNLELTALKNNVASKNDPFKVLSELMNHLLSPSNRQGGPASKIFKLCLAHVSVVFGLEKVPLDAILSLWSQVLISHPETSTEMAGDANKMELAKRVWFIAEAFIHLGLFSFSEEEGVIIVRLHHPLYVQYGNSLIPEFSAAGVAPDETIARWNSTFVTGYNARLRAIKESDGGLRDMSRPYVLRKIITHMINSKAIPKVLEMLKDDRFCRERMAKFGWLKGTRMHLDDCQLLKDRAIQSKSTTAAETNKVVLACLKKISSILSEEPDITDDTRVEKAKALFLVGFTQADNAGINDALTSYKNAMQLMPNASHPFNVVIMYSQAALHLMRNDHDKALKKLKSCTKVLKDLANDDDISVRDLHCEIAQLRGDALLASCDYVAAETCYEEALEYVGDGVSRIETGTALFRRARLHQTVGELDQAIAALTECINWKLDIGETASRSLANAYSVIGDIYVDYQEDEKAVRQYHSALETLEALGVEDKSIEKLLLQGKIEALSGNLETSRKTFEAVRLLIKKTPILLMDQSAYDLRVVGKMCMDIIDKALGKEIFEEGIDLTMDRPDSLERASILYELGQCLFHFQESKDAVVCLEEALKIRKAKLGDCESVLDSQITLGNVYRKVEMKQECLTASKEVMFLTEKLYRGDEAKAASALFGVAEAYENLGEYSDSVAMFEECKELLKRALCNDHPDVANVLQRLGRLHVNFTDFEKAFTSYEEALVIGRANFEVEDPQIGEILYRIGNVCRKRGDYDRAKEYLQECLVIFKNKEIARETCLSLIELGKVYRLMSDPDTALMCFERCFTFIEEKEDDIALLEALQLCFGHARLCKRQTTEAQTCFESALKYRTERLGKDHPLTAKASRSLGVAKYMQKCYTEARIYLEDFVRVSEAHRCTTNLEYVLALQILGETYNAESRGEEAKRYWEKAKFVIAESTISGDMVPELLEMLSHRLEKAPTTAKETKTLFSMFTELARFEDEVSPELPVEERLQDILRTYIFLDDDIPG